MNVTNYYDDLNIYKNKNSSIEKPLTASKNLIQHHEELKLDQKMYWELRSNQINSRTIPLFLREMYELY